MTAKIEWYYRRPNCETCQKMDTLLEKLGIEAVEVVNARKERFDTALALKMARAAQRILVTKGQKVVEFDMPRDEPDDETLSAHLIGPSGNLRAPAIRAGKTLLVGFNADAFGPILNGEKR